MRKVVLGSLAVLVAACGLDVTGGIAPGGAAPDGGSPSAEGGVTRDGASPDDGGAIAVDGGGPGRQKAITIDPARVGGALADFPVWIDLVDADVAARAKADASDVWFAGADGAPLAHEIQAWDPAAKHLSAWVRVPSLSNAAPTTIALRYGDATGAPAQAPAQVFASGFVAVWHLDDALTTAAIADATGTHPGTGVGLGADRRVAAKLGSGVSFAGGTDEITFTNPIAGTGPHTISLWVSQRTTTDNDALVVLGDAVCGESRWFHARYGSATTAVGFYCNDWADPGVDVINAGWTLLHWVYDDTTGTSRIYRDGALAAGPYAQIGTTISTIGSGGHLANAPGGWGQDMGAHASLDEVRIATVARSPAWIATEFANQSSPSTFYTVGPEAPAP